jgi:uncharacterized protein with HEPN domain
MGKDDLIFVDHILEAIEKIDRYTDDITVHEFVDNELIQDAVIRNFEIIGEASKNVSNEFREKYTSIPWKKMSGMRDILIHDYLGIDLYSVWETIEKDLPNLKIEILKILNQSDS